MADQRRKIAIGMGFDNGEKAFGTSETPSGYYRRDELRGKGMMAGSFWARHTAAPENGPAGTDIANSIVFANTKILEVNGFAITQRRGGKRFGIVSPPPGSYREKLPIRQVDATVRMVGWVSPPWVTSSGLPVQGGYVPGPVNIAGFSGIPNVNYLVPPFTHGTVTVRGAREDEAYDVFAISLTGANSPQVIFTPPRGWFDVTLDMTGQDIINVNGGLFNAGYGITGSMPNFTSAIIWWAEWRLYR